MLRQEYDAGALEETFAAHLLACGELGHGLALPSDLGREAWRAWEAAEAMQRAQRASFLAEVHALSLSPHFPALI